MHNGCKHNKYNNIIHNTLNDFDIGLAGTISWLLCFKFESGFELGILGDFRTSLECLPTCQYNLRSEFVNFVFNLKSFLIDAVFPIRSGIKVDTHILCFKFQPSIRRINYNSTFKPYWLPVVTKVNTQSHDTHDT